MTGRDARFLAIFQIVAGVAMGCQPCSLGGDEGEGTDFGPPTEGEGETAASDAAAHLLSARNDVFQTQAGGAWVESFSDFDPFQCTFEWHGPGGIDDPEVEIEQIAQTSFGSLWRAPADAQPGDVFAAKPICANGLAGQVVNHFILAGALPSRPPPRVVGHSVVGASPYHYTVCSGGDEGTGTPETVTLSTAVVDVQVDTAAPALLADLQFTVVTPTGPSTFFEQPAAYDVTSEHVRVPLVGAGHRHGTLRFIDLPAGSLSDSLDFDAVTAASCATGIGAPSAAAALALALLSPTARSRKRRSGRRNEAAAKRVEE